MKIISWNINGMSAFAKKNVSEYFKQENADIVCFQETKGRRDNDLAFLGPGYRAFWADSKVAGYSGVCTAVRIGGVELGPAFEDDEGGRVLAIDVGAFYVVNVYVPNAGDKLKRLDFKMKWFGRFNEYLNKLKERKGVLVAGDFNVAHEEIDIERPAANIKTAGFTVEERGAFSNFLKNGWTDTYRDLNGQSRCYTFWSARSGARAKDIGWRLDYIVSAGVEVQSAFIRKFVMGSDHCPIGVIC